MQRTSRTAAGRHREILLAMFNRPFLIRTGYKMLESRRIRRVARNGNVHGLLLHDGNALVDIVCTVAAYVRTVAVRKLPDLRNGQLSCGKIKIRLHIRKAVNSGNDIRGILAQTVKNDLKRFLSDLIRRPCDSDRALRSGKRFMARQEAEALRLFTQQHGAKISMPETDLSGIQNACSPSPIASAASAAFFTFF